MDLATRHPEEIKSALRMRYGSVFAFEDALDLPRKSVSDVLRGRTNRRVQAAINKALSSVAQSDKSDVSETNTHTHCLNAEAR